MNTTARKISPTLSLIDETADFSHGKEYALHILSGFGHLSLAVAHIEQHKFAALESYHLQHVFSANDLSQTIRSIIDAHPFLKMNFAQVKFAYDSNRSTLVPDALFEAQKLKSYIQFNHPVEKGELIFSDQLKNVEAHNVFLFPEILKERILSFYPKALIRHYSSALLESLAVRSKNESTPKLIIQISMTHFEIIRFEGKHLRFYNTFRHQTSEDFIYYLLFVCEQLKLNPETLDLVLLGEVEKDSAIYQILQKYVRNIRFGERPDAFTYSHPLNSIPPHFYCNLFFQQLFG